jgi:hypothetical protein
VPSAEFTEGVKDVAIQPNVRIRQAIRPRTGVLRLLKCFIGRSMRVGDERQSSCRDSFPTRVFELAGTSKGLPEQPSRTRLISAQACGLAVASCGTQTGKEASQQGGARNDAIEVQPLLGPVGIATHRG